MQARRLKRLQKEQRDNETPSNCFYIQPIDKKLLNWHFTLLGLPDSCYKDGVYHGYIRLPENYPLSPPDFFFFNESGRYMPNKKICLNISSYHKESWSPVWGLRTMMEAISAYFHEDGSGIGALRDSDANRKKFAIKSRKYKCDNCGKMPDIEKMIRSHYETKKPTKSPARVKKIKKIKRGVKAK